MQQLNGTLDRLLDIQHPERVKDRTKEQSLKHRTQAFTVNTQSIRQDGSFFGNASSHDTITKVSTARQNGFYGLDEPVSNEAAAGAIAAVIHETQTLVAGSTVKLRLLNDIYVAGVLIPKGTFVYGTASLSDERLTIAISSIRSNTNLLPVSLAVYDMDGMPGVYMPGSISRDAAKNAADQGLQSTDIINLDPSLAAQATSAGIQATKGLLSRKVKLVKVTVKAGYKVLLKDNNKQDY
jgi:conjugative transposon TraM protein